MRKTACLLATAGTVAAFTSNSAVDRPTRVSQSALFGGASGYATTLEGKTSRVANIKERLDTSQMVFTCPAGGLTVAQTQSLRRSLPEGSSVSVVKNTLMARALEGTDYDVATDLAKGPSMWFFIEDDIGGTIKAFNSFAKDFDKKESHAILGGAMEGVVYDPAGVKAIGALPSKDELIARIAGGINAVPTKLARVVKAPNSKLARAIKLATEENSE
mmetsp:Transcript_561/g.1655  ORF Transcript_561/g.1655 Transcript_561/m.1655 type:complete len:217 (-) Transcript_561:92-742(-)|eukprot:CAMPEP_0181046958 /NCGR_PEP_ID=MMETSP1070-20121207/14620_1 /TAXON_ID=265543 /ORGANISM="Minutocellus polymorphus, Strain NH13" /LENGTH=216 /DNA_ID=CAMNT_0023125591 /DNA_START=36 /DNA_END=686 /DNA_ORIENTATION=-